MHYDESTGRAGNEVDPWFLRTGRVGVEGSPVMKAISCIKPFEFQLVDIEKPAKRAGEALIHVRRVGVCGTDIHAFHGNQPYFTYPRILGHEIAGVIEELDDGVDGFFVGDQVAVVPYMHCGKCIACRNGKPNCCTDMRVLGVHIDGAMAEWISVPVTHLVKTNDLTLDQSAIIEPLSIGAHAVRRSGITKNDSVLVIGGGPIGLGVMAFAKRKGANVVAMDTNVERLEFCRTWAHINASVSAFDQPMEAITAQITANFGGEYPTAVFDATGSVGSMNSALQYVAHGGKLIFVGLVKENVTFPDPEFHKRETTLLSSRNATREDFQEVHKAMVEGFIDDTKYITNRIAFADLADEFERITSPEAKAIKVIVDLI